MKMLSVTDRQDIVVEQVSLVLGQNLVLSFQENGANYLLSALVDAIVDQYFALLEVIGERIEVLQDLVVSDHKPDTVHRIHALKRQLLFLRRGVWRSVKRRTISPDWNPPSYRNRQRYSSVMCTITWFRSWIPSRRFAKWFQPVSISICRASAIG